MSTTPDTPERPDMDVTREQSNAFDELAARAGAALRRPAPADGVDQIAERRRHQRVIRASVAGGVAAALLIGGWVVVASENDRDGLQPVDSEPTSTDAPASPPKSPFVGYWQSTDTDGSSQTMAVDQWGADEYFVELSDEDPACPGSRQITGTARPATDTSLTIAGPDAYCWDAQGSSPPVSDPEPVTLDLSPGTGELVDNFGVVWSRQVVPPLDAGDTALLESFLAARLAGQGAEQYLLTDIPDVTTPMPPLLYSTSTGVTYERFEIEPVPEPDALPGWTAVDVRLYSADGTVVEQGFHVIDQDGQLGLVYGQIDDLPTTENWRSVPVPFSILDGEVTFAAAPPWRPDCCGSDASSPFQKSGWNLAWFMIAAEPLSVGTACDDGPAPTDAATLADSIETAAGSAASEPVPARIGGIDGFQIDVAMDDRIPWLCAWTPDALSGFQGGGQMRFYVVDYPGESADVLTFAFLADPEKWDDAVDDIAPILDSIEFPSTAPGLEVAEAGDLSGFPWPRYSPDGSLLAVETDSGVSIYDSGTLSLLHELPCPTSLESFQTDSRDYVWDLAAAARWDDDSLSIFKRPRLDLCDVSLNADGSRAVTSASIQADAPYHSLLWDTSDGSFVAGIEGSATFSADGSTLIGGSGSNISLLDVATGAVLTSTTFDTSITAFSADGRRVVGWSREYASDGTVLPATIYDTQTLTPVATLSTRSPDDVLGFVDFVFDDTNSLVATFDVRGVTIWDASTGIELQRIPIRFDYSVYEGHSGAFSPGGAMIAVPREGHITIFDTSTGVQLADLEVDERIVPHTAEFSADGLTLLTAFVVEETEESGVRVWSYAYG